MENQTAASIRLLTVTAQKDLSEAVMQQQLLPVEHELR
jgi:hypothetical protein